MAEASSSVNNGVNVAALIEAREAFTKAPAAAQFKWRAACEWKDGTHTHSTVEGFYGLGQEQHHKKTFTFDADHPEIFASEDKGATPIEYVLVGLASCLTAGIAAVAGGISEALITTALGLLVAVPAVWLFNYFTGKVDGFVVEMDNSASELVDYFIKNRTKQLKP